MSQISSTLLKTLVLLLVLAAAMLVAGQDNPFEEVMPKPVPLFNDDSFPNWKLLNATQDSFSFSNNVLRVSGENGWLQSPDSFGDFSLMGEFRFLQPDSDSGIFLRVVPGTDFIRGWPGNAYQVQIREISVNDSDNPLPLANVYRHVVADGNTDYKREQVFDLYKGTDQWHALLIRAEGSQLKVFLDGRLVTVADDLVNDTGHIGFQSEKGVIEYRNMVIYE